MENKVSIVIPCYNGEDFIRESIQSAIDQTWVNKEIIVIDDGSTDKSLEIIKEYKEVQYFSKPNGGTSSALNLGIRRATGEWIHWLSADDVLYDNAIEKMMEVIDKTSNAYDYIYYTSYEIIDEDGSFKRVHNEPDYSKLGHEIRVAEQFHNFYGNGSSSMIARQKFKEIGGFKEDFGYGEDYEFWLRWGLKYKFDFKLVPIVSLMYREHSKSLTGTKNLTDNRIKVEKLRSMYHKYLTPKQLEYLKTRKEPLKRRLAKKLPNTILKKLLEIKHR
jgi:glycosyltransferase involved in cell wall biosynthesis